MMAMTHPERKPRVGLAAIERLLMRHVAVVAPESRLLVAVIAQAMGDAKYHDGHLQRRAVSFLTGTGLNNYAELIGLEPDFVREVARKTGYLSPPKTPGKPQKLRKSQNQLKPRKVSND